MEKIGRNMMKWRADLFQEGDYKTQRDLAVEEWNNLGRRDKKGWNHVFYNEIKV